jgi:hypothetical protein
MWLRVCQTTLIAGANARIRVRTAYSHFSLACASAAIQNDHFWKFQYCRMQPLAAQCALSVGCLRAALNLKPHAAACVNTGIVLISAVFSLPVCYSAPRHSALRSALIAPAAQFRSFRIHPRFIAWAETKVALRRQRSGWIYFGVLSIVI